MALLLKDDDVTSLFTMDMALDALEELFRQRGSGNAVVRPRTRMALPDGSNNLMAGWVGKPINAYGLKMYGGAGGGYGTTAKPLVLLYDGTTGALLAILEAARLGAVRTGAASGIGTRYMAREDASTVGMIGVGGQAATQLEAVCKVRDIRQALVYSRTEAKREAFAKEMTQALGIHVTVEARYTRQRCGQQQHAPRRSGRRDHHASFRDCCGRCGPGQDRVRRVDKRHKPGTSPMGAGTRAGGGGIGPRIRKTFVRCHNAFRVPGHRHGGRGCRPCHLRSGPRTRYRHGDSAVAIGFTSSIPHHH